MDCFLFTTLYWYVVAIANSYFCKACFYFCVGNGSSGIYLAAVGTNIKNFSPAARGTVVGLLVGMYGISGALFSILYELVFHRNIVHFMFYMACICAAVPIVFGILFLNVIPADGSDAKKRGNLFYSISTQEEEITPTDEPIGDPQQLWEPEKKEIKEDTQQHYNFFQMIRTLDFYVFVVVYACGVGSGIFFFNNVGSLYISLGGKDGTFVQILQLARWSEFFGYFIIHF